MRHIYDKIPSPSSQIPLLIRKDYIQTKKNKLNIELETNGFLIET